VRSEYFAFHHLGEAQNRVQRRAQFVAHLRQETRLGDIGGLGMAPCFVRLGLGLFEFADQRILFGPRLERSERRREQAVRQHREVALRRHRQGGKDVAVHVSAQQEIERDRSRHRRAGGEHGERYARRQHARHGDDQQHDEQHECGAALLGPDQVDDVHHPRHAEKEIEQDEARAPRLQRQVGGSAAEERAAHRDDDGVNHHHGGRPDAGLDRAGPEGRQDPDGGDEE
jgi:hypothetical protein